MPTIVTACYGRRHRHFLGAMLESLEPFSQQVVVVHDGIPWLRYYPVVQGVMTDVEFGSLREELVARRQVAWEIGLSKVPDGQSVVLLDADTLVQGDLDQAFGINYDVAFTARPESPWPINAGVVFMRAGYRARHFMRSWRDLCGLMLQHPNLGPLARSRWGAVDQAALYMTRGLFSGKEPFSFHVLPCAIWNQAIATSDRHVVIHHLKGCLPFLLGEAELKPEDDRYRQETAWLFGRWRECYERHRDRIGRVL